PRRIPCQGGTAGIVLELVLSARPADQRRRERGAAGVIEHQRTRSLAESEPGDIKGPRRDGILSGERTNGQYTGRSDIARNDHLAVRLAVGVFVADDAHRTIVADNKRSL